MQCSWRLITSYGIISPSTPCLPPSAQASRTGSASSEDLAVLKDAARYFLDVGATLAALLWAHPEGAALMLAGEGAELLPALSAAHDQVAPGVARAIGARERVRERVARVKLGILSFSAGVQSVSWVRHEKQRFAIEG